MCWCTFLHIPDGYLDPYTAIATYIIALSTLALAIAKIRGGARISDRDIARVTTIAAFIFVAQMIAWPIPFGTSLHLVGGALAGILVGPWLGLIAMSIVLLVQCLVFHDGGITALGANILKWV